MWIDAQEAVIVLHSDQGQETARIKSKAEPPQGRSSEPEKESLATRDVPRAYSHERENQGGLERYYEAIISHIRRPDEILIFGPDEAKCELKKRIKESKGILRILTLEFGDKMTEPRIVARVRQHFEHLAPRAIAQRHAFPTLNHIKSMRTLFCVSVALMLAAEVSADPSRYQSRLVQQDMATTVYNLNSAQGRTEARDAKLRRVETYLATFPDQQVYWLDHFALHTGQAIDGIEVYDLGAAPRLTY